MLASFKAIRDALSAGDTSCVDIVNYYLHNIHKHRDLNALVEVYDSEAIKRAEEIDLKLQNGNAGKLAGMVVSVKDVICHKDHGLQGCSKILHQFQSQYNSTVIQRLLSEDAIIIGRTNCDEFGMGSSNETSASGPVKNAADPTRVPGGSSGGSAVAVQANMCLASVASDTGGSVRQPAAFCGVIGLKPTYSRISRCGLIAYASSFDCIGILAKDIEDCALVLEIIAGSDDFDSTVSTEVVPQYSEIISADKMENLKICYFEEIISSEGLQEEIGQNISSTLSFLKDEGHKVDAVSFELIDYALPTYYILTTAEASSNLSRFDGVRYGYRSNEALNLEEMYKKSRSEAFGDEVKRRILLGTFVLSASYYDAYYTQAQKVRRLIREQLKALVEDYDFIIMPTTPTTAFRLGEHTKDPLAMYLADLFTVPASLAGLPSISIPCGVDKEGMPIGLQIIANDYEEGKLFNFSNYLLNTRELNKKVV